MEIKEPELILAKPVLMEPKVGRDKAKVEEYFVMIGVFAQCIGIVPRQPGHPVENAHGYTLDLAKCKIDIRLQRPQSCQPSLREDERSDHLTSLCWGRKRTKISHWKNISKVVKQ